MLNRAPGWVDSLRIYLHPRVRPMIFLGFSSGLPLLLVYGTLSFRLREAGIERATIGFLSWVALAYGFKWVWAPVVDRARLPVLTRLLGRRRGWLLLAQAVIVAGLVGMALSDPRHQLFQLVAFALVVAYASATQDVVIDAYRIERGLPEHQGAMAALYMVGYRVAMIASFAGVLWIAAAVAGREAGYHQAAWLAAYATMAALMAVGVLTTLLVPEPEVRTDEQTARREALVDERFAARAMPRWLRRVVTAFYKGAVGPFVEFVARYRWHAALVLALIATYRISDIVLGAMANVFYVDLGFSKTEVGNITGVFGIVMTLTGSMLGGLMVVRIGVMPILLAGAVMAALTNLLFAALALIGNDIAWLALVVAADNLSAGIATAAFVAYLSGLTNVSYSATQYALFSSVMLLFPKVIGGFSGVMVDAVGYPVFFTLTATMGVPVIVLVVLAMRFLPTSARAHGA